VGDGQLGSHEPVADPELSRRDLLKAGAPIVGKVASQLGDAAAGLQDVLGDHQDSVTAQRWLRGAGQQGQRAFVAGELCAMERDAAAHDRAEWPKVWKKVDRKRLRRWMI